MFGQTGHTERDSTWDKLEAWPCGSLEANLGWVQIKPGMASHGLRAERPRDSGTIWHLLLGLKCVIICYRTKLYFGGHAIFQWNFDMWYSCLTKRASSYTFHREGRGSEFWFWVDSVIVTVPRSSWMLGQQMQCVNLAEGKKSGAANVIGSPKIGNWPVLLVPCDFYEDWKRDNR